MDDFVVRGNQGCFIRITLVEVFGFPNMTSHFGGYDVKGTTEIEPLNKLARELNNELMFKAGNVDVKQLSPYEFTEHGNSAY